MTVGYLFDFDRTLVTYEPDIPGIFRNACEAVGVEPPDDAADIIRTGYVETFCAFDESPYLGAARAARDAGLDVDPERLAEAHIEAELAATTVPDGVGDLLASLSSVGIVTNGYGPVQRRKLAETGLEPHVDAVVCADDVEAFKPDNAPFDAITAALPAGDYVMVGDSVEYDIRPAAERGYRTVYVGDGDAAEADICLSSPAHLPALPRRLDAVEPTDF
ncbi:HAD superfamily hydrolase [Natronomonas pharaonis DSM 2160]|uniref:HAD superfamily hydrolase n=1 Tax=Natronomonas pharaonis (strain ATCC 35678 / DSM 2160 / CIP 103997 / JCM 8858 / NBRC 14720 / NCIMB 2260 / Gabara) TaxID=348780 RepID=A0A1U7EX42_NATPD|nr:HAD family hydrolase [Natronomonas pharaonis]CAI49682.1 HAD superfamily hydrolase [Natronomonas pharaonis DSM 2160]